MKDSAIITLILAISCASSEIHREFVYFVGCSMNGSEVELSFNDEEVAYIDFQRKELVFTLPRFFGVDQGFLFEGIRILANSLRNKNTCTAVLAYLIEEFKNPTEEKEPPQSAIYTSDEVELGIDNSLICFVNSFYPPPIKVSWTKNGQPVSEEASLSRYYPNNDGTFHQFSSLPFTPSKGDIYSCSVEHPALEEPKVKIWEPELSSPSLGPDIFCGVGLAVAMLGVAAGTFFIVKSHHGQ